VKNITAYPKGWDYACCGGDGASKGCKFGKHDAPEPKPKPTPTPAAVPKPDITPASKAEAAVRRMPVGAKGGDAKDAIEIGNDENEKEAGPESC